MAEPRTSSKDKRTSIAAMSMDKDADGTSSKGTKYLAGERRLSVTSLRLRSDVEMWLMDAVPKMMGKEDSASLPITMQEDAQSEFLNQILFQSGNLDDTVIIKAISATFGHQIDEDKKPGYAQFEQDLLAKIRDVRGAFAQARKESKEIPKEQSDVAVDGAN